MRTNSTCPLICRAAFCTTPSCPGGPAFRVSRLRLPCPVVATGQGALEVVRGNQGPFDMTVLIFWSSLRTLSHRGFAAAPGRLSRRRLLMLGGYQLGRIKYRTTLVTEGEGRDQISFLRNGDRGEHGRIVCVIEDKQPEEPSGAI